MNGKTPRIYGLPKFGIFDFDFYDDVVDLAKLDDENPSPPSSI
jgi:hypothetical protein